MNPSLTVAPPILSPEIAASLAARHFGILGTLTQLSSERDLNFRLTTGDAAYHVNRLAHRSVVQATGNRVLLEVFDDLWGRAVTLRAWADYYASTPMNIDVESDHAALLSSLRSGSPDRAQQAMVEHVREGLHRHGSRSVTAP